MSLRTLGAGGTIVGWRAARERAEDAPQLLRPGLLAAQIPGGAAYAGVTGADHLDAIAAADRTGAWPPSHSDRRPRCSPASRCSARTHRLVVADLPAGSAGLGDLRALGATRTPGELLLVVQRARAPRGHELLWAGAAGLPGRAQDPDSGSSELRARSAHRRPTSAA